MIVKNTLSEYSFFNENKRIDGNKYNLISLLINCFVIIPLVLASHELTDGYGIEDISLKELIRLGLDYRPSLGSWGKLAILGLIVFILVKIYLMKEKRYVLVSRNELLSKWLILLLSLISGLFIFIKQPSLFKPLTSIVIAFLMMVYFYGWTELLLMKMMREVDSEIGINKKDS